MVEIYYEIKINDEKPLYASTYEDVLECLNKRTDHKDLKKIIIKKGYWNDSKTFIY